MPEPDERGRHAPDVPPELHAVRRLHQGAAPELIVRELEERGTPRLDAQHLVETMGAEVRRQTAEETFTATSLLPAAAASLAAAVAGAIIWTIIVAVTDYELGFVAWGIGFAAGQAVVFASGGRRGVPLQVVAAVAAGIGVLLGKYFTFVHVVNDSGLSLSYVSSDAFRLFKDNLDIVFSGFDLLWIGLALFTAFRVPQSRLPDLSG